MSISTDKAKRAAKNKRKWAKRKDTTKGKQAAAQTRWDEQHSWHDPNSLYATLLREHPESLLPMKPKRIREKFDTGICRIHNTAVEKLSRGEPLTELERAIEFNLSKRQPWRYDSRYRKPPEAGQ